MKLVFQHSFDWAHSLRMKVVAEGVESGGSGGQAAFGATRCDQWQGYLFLQGPVSFDQNDSSGSESKVDKRRLEVTFEIFSALDQARLVAREGDGDASPSDSRD